MRSFDLAGFLRIYMDGCMSCHQLSPTFYIRELVAILPRAAVHPERLPTPVRDGPHNEVTLSGALCGPRSFSRLFRLFLCALMA